MHTFSILLVSPVYHCPQLHRTSHTTTGYFPTRSEFLLESVGGSEYSSDIVLSVLPFWWGQPHWGQRHVDRDGVAWRLLLCSPIQHDAEGIKLWSMHSHSILERYAPLSSRIMSSSAAFVQKTWHDVSTQGTLSTASRYLIAVDKFPWVEMSFHFIEQNLQNCSWSCLDLCITAIISTTVPLYTLNQGHWQSAHSYTCKFTYTEN